MKRSEITRKLPSLWTVPDYVVSVVHTDLAVPDNILLFSRLDRRHLRPHNSFHHRFVLIVNLGGHGSICIDEKIIHLGEEQMVLIFPHQFHRYPYVEEPVLNWLFVTFELVNPASVRPLKNIALDLPPGSLGLLNELVDCWLNTRAQQQATSNQLSLRLALLLDELMQDLSNSPHAPGSRQIETRAQVLVDRIHQYVLNHPNEQCTIRKLAVATQVSESHLRSIFRGQLGMNIGQFLRKTRLSRAAGLIHNTDLNISQIADECGFASPYAFARAFKRAFGLPPSEYRSVIRQSAAKQ